MHDALMVSSTRMVIACLVLAGLVATTLFCGLFSRHIQGWRRIVNAMFPLSQIVTIGIIYYVVIVYEAPNFAMIIMTIGGLICIPVDFILIRTLARAKDADLARLQVAMLEEQVAYQQEARLRIQSDLDSAQAIRKRACDELERAQEALNRRRSEEAKAGLSRTLSIVERVGNRHCEHHALDALVDMKLQQCRECGIDALFELAIPRDIDMASIDICALFSNLIDNALHACSDVMKQRKQDAPSVQAEEGKRSVALGSVNHEQDAVNDAGEKSGDHVHDLEQPFIRLTASLVGEMLMVDMQNSISEENGRYVRRRVRASGLDEHGWGLVILEQLAQRYDGVVTTAHDGGVFTTTVLLYPSHDAIQDEV